MSEIDNLEENPLAQEGEHGAGNEEGPDVPDMVARKTTHFVGTSKLLRASSFQTGS